jgi:hypothetical protein
MPPRGNFDKIIAEQYARYKDRGGNKAERIERSMEPLPKNRPRVLMEPDKQEWDYPETRKYNYVRPNSPKENIRPNDPQELGIPKRKTMKVADDGELDPFEYGIKLEEQRKKLQQELDETDFNNRSRWSGQTHPGNKTLHYKAPK